MATTVELGIEIGFVLDDPVAGVLDNTTYTLGGLSYIDMTDYVYSVSIQRGLNRDLDRFNAGTCSITLNNQNRVFDPYNPASPFVGNIKPRRRVRVQTDAVTQFVGSIDDWNLDYSVSGESTASIAAADDFTLLAQQVLDMSVVPEEYSGARVGRVLSMASIDWPIADRQIDTGKSLLSAGTPVGNALDYLTQINDSEQGLMFIGKSGDFVFLDRSNTPTTPSSSTLTRTNLQPYVTLTANTSHFTVTPETNGIDYHFFTAQAGYPSGQTLRLFFQNLVGAREVVNDGITVTAGTNYTANFIATTYQFASSANAELRWYNSGGSLISTTSGSATSLYSNVPTWMSVQGTAPVGAVSARVALVYSDTYAVGGYGFVDFSSVIFETTSTSVAYSYFDGNTTPFGEYYYQWTGAENASTSEQYQIVYDASSTPTIFSDAGDIPFTAATVNYGTELLVNSATISSTAGTVTTSNRESQIAYGIVNYDLTTLISTTTQLTSLSDYIVQRYAEPEYRFQSITVNLDSLNATDRATVLALEIGDIASVQFTPNGVGSSIGQTCSVIGISHDVRPDKHDVVFSFERLPFTFIVLNDPIYGKLDSIGVLGF